MRDALPLAVILPCVPALRVPPVPGEHQCLKVIAVFVCMHASASLSASPRPYPGAVGLGCEKVLLNWPIRLICFSGARRTRLVHSVDFNRAGAEGVFMLSSEVISLRLHGVAQANVGLGASPPYIDYFKGDHCT